MTPEQLKKELKNGVFHPLYLLYGAEPYLVQFYTKQIAKSAVPVSVRDYNLRIFDADSFSLDLLAGRLEALPVFCERTCVVLTHFQPDRLSRAELTRFLEMLTEIPSDCVLLLSILEDPSSYLKSASFKKINSVAEKTGVSIQFDRLPEKKMIAWMRTLAAQNGAQMTDEAAGQLLTKTSDMQMLSMEIPKLAAFSPSEITPGHVDRLVCRSLEVSVYELNRAITSGQSKKALSLLKGLFLQKTDPVTILAIVSKGFIDLYRAKTAGEYKVDSKTAAADFHYFGHEFVMRNAYRDAGKIPGAVLKKALSLLADADIRLKSARADNRLIVEETICKLLFYFKQIN